MIDLALSKKRKKKTMSDCRSRIIDVIRKYQKCPVYGGRVVDIILGTGDMAEE